MSRKLLLFLQRRSSFYSIFFVHPPSTFIEPLSIEVDRADTPREENLRRDLRQLVIGKLMFRWRGRFEKSPMACARAHTPVTCAYVRVLMQEKRSAEQSVIGWPLADLLRPFLNVAYTTHRLQLFFSLQSCVLKVVRTLCTPRVHVVAVFC